MLHIGQFDQDVPADTQLTIDSQAGFTVVEVRDGEPHRLLLTSIQPRNRIFVRQDCTLRIVPQNEFTHTSIVTGKPACESIVN